MLRSGMFDVDILRIMYAFFYYACTHMYASFLTLGPWNSSLAREYMSLFLGDGDGDESNYSPALLSLWAFSNMCSDMYGLIMYDVVGKEGRKERRKEARKEGITHSCSEYIFPYAHSLINQPPPFYLTIRTSSLLFSSSSLLSSLLLFSSLLPSPSSQKISPNQPANSDRRYRSEI